MRGREPAAGTARTLARRLAAWRWLAAFAIAWVSPASAQRIENGVAVFAALDKVTARISRLPIKLGETVRFGALRITPRACYTRQPIEAPRTSTFVEVEEVQLDGSVNKIFSGWMFAESPGLSAVEHPVFDMWLTECAEPLKAAPVARTPAGPQRAPAGKREAQPAAPLPAEPELPEEPAPAAAPLSAQIAVTGTSGDSRDFR